MNRIPGQSRQAYQFPGYWNINPKFPCLPKWRIYSFTFKFGNGFSLKWTLVKKNKEKGNLSMVFWNMGILSKFPLFVHLLVSLLQTFYGSKILYLNNNLHCPILVWLSNIPCWEFGNNASPHFEVRNLDHLLHLNITLHLFHIKRDVGT